MKADEEQKYEPPVVVDAAPEPEPDAPASPPKTEAAPAAEASTPAATNEVTLEEKDTSPLVPSPPMDKKATPSKEEVDASEKQAAEQEKDGASTNCCVIM